MKKWSRRKFESLKGKEDGNRRIEQEELVRICGRHDRIIGRTTGDDYEDDQTDKRDG